MTQLGVETGHGPAFEAAPTLYRARGFIDGATFADHGDNGFSTLLHLDLARA